jgi:hypothetical protein
MRKILIFFILCLLLIPLSYASDTVPVPTNVIQAPHGTHSSLTVQQGGPDSPEIIYWNETVDLSLVEGWYGMVENEKGYIVDVSQFTHQIYIDKNVFPTGVYWQWSPEGIYANGNNIAFEVQQGPRPEQQPLVYNTTLSTPTLTPFPENLPLQPRHIADYLVARGYPLNITLNGTAQIWIMGVDTTSWIPPRTGNTSILYTEEDTQTLIPGNYSVLIQHFGTSNIADVLYQNSSNLEGLRAGELNVYNNVIYSPFGGENTSVVGWQPQMIENAVKALLDRGMWIQQGDVAYNAWDNTYETKTLQVENPYSEITMVDEYTRANDAYNISTVHVAGYTNLPNQTPLSIVLDYKTLNVPQTMLYGKTMDMVQNTTTVGDTIGDRRQFSILFPIYYGFLHGQGSAHFFTVINPDGSLTVANFKVYDTPAGQVVPLQTNRYIAGDEFKPPVTVTVTVPGPERTVTVQVPVIQTQVVIQTVYVVPWYLEIQWIVLWIIIIGVAGFLIWRFLP